MIAIFRGSSNAMSALEINEVSELLFRVAFGNNYSDGEILYKIIEHVSDYVGVLKMYKEIRLNQDPFQLTSLPDDNYSKTTNIDFIESKCIKTDTDIKMKAEISCNPENGEWIKTFYDYYNLIQSKETKFGRQENSKDRERIEHGDMCFVYKFQDGKVFKITAKYEDIKGWALKWKRHKENLNNLKLIMGEDNWNLRNIKMGKNGIIDYTDAKTRLKLFGRKCSNSEKGDRKCYGRLYMSNKFFTKTQYPGKHCEYCRQQLIKKQEMDMVKFGQMAEKVALSVLD